MLDLAVLRDLVGGQATTAERVVEISALRKSFDGRREVLAGIDLTVRRGERVALIGSNGSGKSTLLRCLVGLHPLSGGRVMSLGETFSGLPDAGQRRRLRAQVGFVFQKHCLVRRRTVLSNVVHGMMSQPGSWRGFANPPRLRVGAAPRWRRLVRSISPSGRRTGPTRSRAASSSGWPSRERW
jgi:phosphonate transport system ATP-binding protein